MVKGFFFSSLRTQVQFLELMETAGCVVHACKPSLERQRVAGQPIQSNWRDPDQWESLSGQYLRNTQRCPLASTLHTSAHMKEVPPFVVCTVDMNFMGKIRCPLFCHEVKSRVWPLPGRRSSQGQPTPVAPSISPYLMSPTGQHLC